MSRHAHLDGELRPPSKVLTALEQWLDTNGLRRAALIKPLGTQQVQVSRMFAGSAYLSASQRRAIEEFTGGAITAAMLEGKAPPPPKFEAMRPGPVAVPSESESPAPAPTPSAAARPHTVEDAERIIDELAAKAMPAAFKVIVEQMLKGKSESEKRRCAEIFIEHVRGKAKQFERREKLEPPATDDELISVFDRIKNNLGGGNGDRPVPHVPGGAPGDDFGGEGLA